MPWFEKVFFGGMILAGRNCCHYYRYGRGDYILPEPGKEISIIRQGVERGCPENARKLWTGKRGAEALQEKPVRGLAAPLTFP